MTRWANAPRWNSLSNTLPGWLLPAVGVMFVVLSLVADLIPVVFVTGGVVVIFFGVMGWLNTSLARSLRAVYPLSAAPSAAASPVTGEE